MFMPSRAPQLLLVLVVSIFDLPMAVADDPAAESSEAAVTEFQISYPTWRKARTQQRLAVVAKREDALVLRPVSPESWDWGISEGSYLAIIFPVQAEGASHDPVTAALARVRSVHQDQAVELSIAADLTRQLKRGQELLLLRPPGSSTAAMDRVPSNAPVRYRDVFFSQSVEDRVAMVMAERLRAVGKALHEYHELTGNFPPGIVYGPDGEPWHSWRMILMCVVDKRLFNKYRFDEPWNSLHNRELIRECPAPFRFSDDDSGNTAFVGAIGKGVAFPKQGAEFDGDEKRLGPIYGSEQTATKLKDIVDGLSNTILLGTVGKDAGIPWTKPEDLELTDQFANLGDEGGFGAPFTKDGGNYGIFLLADGTVIGLRTDLRKDVLRNMLTISGGEVPAVSLPQVPLGRIVPSSIVIAFPREDNWSGCLIREVAPASE